MKSSSSCLTYPNKLLKQQLHGARKSPRSHIYIYYIYRPTSRGYLQVISSPRIPTKTPEIRSVVKRFFGSWAPTRWLANEAGHGVASVAFGWATVQPPLEEALEPLLTELQTILEDLESAGVPQTAEIKLDTGECHCQNCTRMSKMIQIFPAAENPESAGECAKLNVPIFHIKWWSSDLWALRRKGSSKVHPP